MLMEKQDDLFRCDNTDKKKALIEEVNSLKDLIVMSQLEGCNKEKIQKYHENKRLASKPYVLWQLDFARVYQEKGGFDIVIGNPPYGIIFDETLKTNYETNYETFKRNNDMYVAFYEKSFNLATEKGIVSLITPNTYLNGDYFKKLRLLIKSKTKIINIIDYKNNAVFADPTVYVAVGIFSKERPEFAYDFKLRIAQDNILTFLDHDVVVKDADEDSIKPSNPIFQKILQKASFNLIDKFDVRDIGFNYWSKGKGKVRGGSIGSRVLYSGEKLDVADIPYLKGRDIDRYFKGTPSNYLKHNYKEFLVEGDTFRFSAEVMENKEKIIYRQTANRIIATIDNEGMYNDKTIHCIIPKDHDINYLYLLGLLNSQLFVYLYRELSQETEGRAFSQVKTVYVKKLPIIVPEDMALIESVVELVKTILEEKSLNENSDTFAYENRLDELVYEIYGITEKDLIAMN